MNILVTGATGFIGSHIVTELMHSGHSITGCARNTSYAKTIFPNIKVWSCDFIKDTSAEIWLSRLKDIDIVINCVGIFFHPNKNIIWAIHHETPKALFDACVQAGVKKIIHISALGIEKTQVNYALSKKVTEEYLSSLPILSVIIRPSFVYGSGSYGGSSLFRGLVGLPWITPIPGKGMQQFQPIHLQDLSKAVLQLAQAPLEQSMILHAASTKRVSLNDILIKLRAWLGFPKARLLHMPLWLIRLGGFFGDFIPYSAINSDSYQLLMQDNVTSEEETNKFANTIGFKPRDFDVGVVSQPSTVQDRWHAKLFFLKPVLKLSLVFIWLFSALSNLLIGGNLITSLLEAGLGLALLFDYKLNKVILLQILLVIGYSAWMTWNLPSLWFDPFGALAKNIPIIVATMVYWALEGDR